MKNRQRIVVALGGNAIAPAGEEGNISQQFAHTRETSAALADLIAAGNQLIITHGNGPQVGNILRRVEIASKEVYRIDLGLCVADTQAGMGYMIGQCLTNELVKRRHTQPVCTVVTTVLVERDDPAFQHPTKPIGMFYTQEEAEEHRRADGWNMVELPPYGCRRIVPSPFPREIVELPMIRALVEAGQLVVCAGGGGIPVVWREGWGYEGVEAVIDKDLSAALLAVGLDADVLAIATTVDKVCVGYGTPQEKQLDRLTLGEAQRLMSQGEFPPGSMGPKIQASIDFLEQARRENPRVLIAAWNALPAAMEGQGGTWIVKED